MGFRGHHIFLTIVLLILALNINYIYHSQNLIKNALETQGRILDVDAGRGVTNIVQYVDQRTGKVYVMKGIGRHRSSGEIVNVLYNPDKPYNAMMKDWDIWQVPRVSIVPLTIFSLFSVFLWKRTLHQKIYDYP